MTKEELTNVYGGISFTGLLANYVSRGIYLVYAISRKVLTIIHK